MARRTRGGGYDAAADVAGDLRQSMATDLCPVRVGCTETSASRLCPRRLQSLSSSSLLPSVRLTIAVTQREAAKAASPPSGYYRKRSNKEPGFYYYGSGRAKRLHAGTSTNPSLVIQASRIKRNWKALARVRTDHSRNIFLMCGCDRKIRCMTLTYIVSILTSKAIFRSNFI